MYNYIIRLPTQAILGVITSTVYLKLKYHTNERTCGYRGSKLEVHRSFFLGIPLSLLGNYNSINKELKLIKGRDLNNQRTKKIGKERKLETTMSSHHPPLYTPLEL